MNYLGKSVLVTGCSSGIGRASALYMAREGFTVFAGVRKESDARKLRELAPENLFPVCPLDLARPEQLPAVLEEISGKLND